MIKPTSRECVSRRDNESKVVIVLELFWKTSLAMLKTACDTGEKKIHLTNFTDTTNIITWHSFTKNVLQLNAFMIGNGK